MASGAGYEEQEVQLLCFRHGQQDLRFRLNIFSRAFLLFKHFFIVLHNSSNVANILKFTSKTKCLIIFLKWRQFSPALYKYLLIFRWIHGPECVGQVRVLLPGDQHVDRDGRHDPGEVRPGPDHRLLPACRQSGSVPTLRHFGRVKTLYLLQPSMAVKKNQDLYKKKHFQMT